MWQEEDVKRHRGRKEEDSYRQAKESGLEQTLPSLPLEGTNPVTPCFLLLASGTRDKTFLLFQAPVWGPSFLGQGCCEAR